MNLLEFKRFCLKRQNYDYVYVFAETDSSNKELEFAKVIPKEQEDVNTLKASITDNEIEIAKVICKNDIKLVSIYYNEYSNIQSLVRVVNEVKPIKTEDNESYWLKASINNGEVQNIKKLNDSEKVWLSLIIESKNEVVVNVSKTSLIYKVFVNNIIAADAEQFKNALNYKEEFITKIIITTALNLRGINNYKENFESKINIADKNTFKASNILIDNLEINLTNINPLLVRSCLILKDNFLAKLNIMEGNEISSNLGSNGVNLTHLNIGRKAVLADYSNNNLKQMTIFKDNKETKTLEDLNYKII